jgi:hypothetical protein
MASARSDSILWISFSGIDQLWIGVLKEKRYILSNGWSQEKYRTAACQMVDTT